jgi:transposase
MRRRGETIERSFAHVYDTGGMRRTHLRGHSNILKRLLIHAGGSNLGLVMRQVFGVGTPRGLQGRLAAAMAIVMALWTVLEDRWTRMGARRADRLPLFTPSYCFALLPVTVQQKPL